MKSKIIEEHHLSQGKRQSKPSSANSIPSEKIVPKTELKKELLRHRKAGRFCHQETRTIGNCLRKSYRQKENNSR